MLDRAPPIDDAVEPLCRSDVMRVISIAAVCAARRAIDRERHAHAIAQAGRDYPSIPLLLRDPKASLDVDYSRQLVNIAVAFVETLTRLSAAAEMMDRGTYVPLGRYDAKPGPVHIVGKTALWVHELSFPITVTRALVEQRDYGSLGCCSKRLRLNWTKPCCRRRAAMCAGCAVCFTKSYQHGHALPQMR
jgi:hypothetical protein